MLFIGDKNHGLGLNLIKRIHNDLAGFDNYLTKVDSINFTFTNISSKSGNFSWPFSLFKKFQLLMEKYWIFLSFSKRKSLRLSTSSLLPLQFKSWQFRKLMRRKLLKDLKFCLSQGNKSKTATIFYTALQNVSKSKR